MGPTPVPAPGPRRGAVYDWFSEFALVSVTVVVAAGMSRLFTDSSFLRDVLALAVVSHVIAAAARRARLSTPSAALLWVVGLVVTATMLLYGQTAWFVLPTLDTFDAARDHLVDSWSVINASEAPVEPVPGLVLSAGAVLGLSAFLADTAAFRMRAAVTSVVPVSAVYGFTIAAGTGDGAVVHGALFSGTIGATMVALRLRNRRADAWIEPGPGRGALALARAGAAYGDEVRIGDFSFTYLDDTEAAVWAASKAMFASRGDPNNFLMTQSEYEQLLELAESGAPYAGIGIGLREDDTDLQGKLDSQRSAVWVQVARLAIRSLGQRSRRVIGTVARWLYGSYVWMVLVAVGLPCWVLLLLTPSRTGHRTGPALLRWISRITLRLGGLQPVVAGLEHLTAVRLSGQSRFLIVSNHASYLDILVLMAALPFDFSFVAKREAASWPFVGTFIRRCGYLTVDRENARGAVQDSRRIEERVLGGTPVHVFPEGPVSHASGLRPFPGGAFQLAADTGSPLLPVPLRGTRQVLRDGRLLPSPAPLGVVISPAIQPGGKGWPEMIRLRDAAYAEVLKHCGEGPLDLVLAGPPRAGAE